MYVDVRIFEFLENILGFFLAKNTAFSTMRSYLSRTYCMNVGRNDFEKFGIRFPSPLHSVDNLYSIEGKIVVT